MATTKVDVNLISATGTASSSTFLRGDSAWEAPSGGFEALIGSTVISNDATISFTVDTTYDIYKFVLVDVVPATDSSLFYMRFGDSGGIDSGASDYAWFLGGNRCSSGQTGSTSTGNAASDNADAQMVLGYDYSGGSNDVGSAAGEGLNCIIHVNANETSGGTMNTCYTAFGGFWDPAAVFYPIIGSGGRKTPLVLTTVQFLFSSGNLSTGRITCFGLKHAA